MTDPPVILKMFPDRDEPEMLEFYSVLGACVSSWAFIDRRLYEIFHKAFGGDHRQSALMFYRQRAFNNRLRLVNDTLKAILSEDVTEKHWKPLSKRVGDLANMRNIFAHHPAKRTGRSRDGKPHYTYTIYIEPYERVLNTEYPGLQGKDELTLDDLRQHDNALELVEHDLRWFWETQIPPKGGP
jgi:hypothetical protein